MLKSLKYEEMQDRIKEIEACAGDYEVAHSKEDSLYLDFIDYLARMDLRNVEIGEIKYRAQDLQKTQNIDFVRYTA